MIFSQTHNHQTSIATEVGVESLEELVMHPTPPLLLGGDVIVMLPAPSTTTSPMRTISLVAFVVFLALGDIGDRGMISDVLSVDT